MDRLWGWFDTATNRRVSVNCAPSKEYAEMQLRQWVERDAKGGRPDIHHIWPTVVVMPLDEMPEGS